MMKLLYDIMFLFARLLYSHELLDHEQKLE